MKIYIYQRLDIENKLFEKISKDRKEVEDFAFNDLIAIAGDELGTNPDTGETMKMRDWDLIDAIDIIWHCEYPINLLRFNEI